MKEYKNPWTYQGKIFDSEDIKDYVGFVYLITHIPTGRKYIGRKYLKQHRKPKGAKRRVTQESNWHFYYGSCKELQELVKLEGEENFKREILSLHKTEGRTNFEETRQLFLNNVLTEKLENGESAYFNNQILSRYFKKDYFDKE
ncbi:MAG: NAD synthetase [Proteobacteria bacterium]|nr:NAD synthetase [Pseudomonadota bacterium]